MLAVTAQWDAFRPLVERLCSMLGCTVVHIDSLNVEDMCMSEGVVRIPFFKSEKCGCMFPDHPIDRFLDVLRRCAE